MKASLPHAATGLVLGFCLSRIGFSSWDEVHRMFVFADLRLFLAFVSAVGVLLVAWRVVAALSSPKPVWPTRSVHPGTLVGGVAFGAGWALTGACPAIALVQLGEGQGAAALTLGGIFLGNYAYARVHERYFRWSTTSCADD